MSDQQSPSGQTWVCRAPVTVSGRCRPIGNFGPFHEDCGPSSSVPYVQDDLYDRMTRSPGSSSPAGEQAESSEADQMRAAWAKACASLSPSAPSTPVDERATNEPSVLSWLTEHGPASQREINHHFHANTAAEVRSLLSSGEVVIAARPAAPSTPVDEAEQAAWIDLLVCQRCKGPLAQPGALIFSPPTKADEVRKIHLCHWCYPILLTWLDSHIAEIRDDLPAAPPVSPPVPERLDVTELPEWAALVDAVNDDGGSVAGYRANVTGRASALTRAVRAAAADREDRADG